MDFQVYQILILVGVLDLVAAFVIKVLFSRNDWPIVEGTVTAADIEEKNGNYRPKVEYEYRVRGETFQGTRIAAMGTSYSNKTSAENICKKYPVGRTVQVYHHPQEPHKSVLNPNTPPVFYAILVSGIAFIIIGIWWMIFP